MRKSNAELWDEAFDAEGYAAAVRADEAEHAKEEQRQACLDAVKAAGIDMGGVYIPDYVITAILNAGKTPALKPDMLVWSAMGHRPFAWHEGAPDGQNYVPLTKPECMVYVDKAPATQPGSMDAEVQSYLDHHKAPE